MMLRFSFRLLLLLLVPCLALASGNDETQSDSRCAVKKLEAVANDLHCRLDDEARQSRGDSSRLHRCNSSIDTRFLAAEERYPESCMTFDDAEDFRALDSSITDMLARMVTRGSQHLFFQTAQRGSYRQGVLELEGQIHHTHSLGSLPDRQLESLSTQDFVTFLDDRIAGGGEAPEVGVILVSGTGSIESAMRINSAEYSNGTLRYQVETLSGSLPSEFAATTAFIRLPSAVTPLASVPAAGYAGTLSLWAEAPWSNFEPKVLDAAGYFDDMLSFASNKGIDRLIVRVQDPNYFNQYKIGTSTACPSEPAECIKATQADADACCQQALDPSAWCSTSSSSAQYCTTTGAKPPNPTPCGVSSSGSQKFTFFENLLFASSASSTPVEIFVLPSIGFGSTWSSILTASYDSIVCSDIQAATSVTQEKWDGATSVTDRWALWVQIANEFAESQTSPRPTLHGMMFEVEGTTPVLYPSIDDALGAMALSLFDNLDSASAWAFTNSSTSPFKLFSASHYNLNPAKLSCTDTPPRPDCVYLNEIYPQFYNLTSDTSPVQIDATNSWGSCDPTQQFAPIDSCVDYATVQTGTHFPDTLYTQTDATTIVTGLSNLSTISSQHQDRISYMFSTEVAIPSVGQASVSNPYYPAENFMIANVTGCAMAGSGFKPCRGTINAFGSADSANPAQPLWSWTDFVGFMNTFDQTANSGKAAIFQYNMLPGSWRN